MITRISQQRLESYLWGAATLLRGTIDAGDYKQFIFPLLFFKRLCDVFDEETKLALKESGGDADFAAYPENHRFQVPQQAHWFEVRQTSNSVGKALQSAMRTIEKANPDKLYGIFGDAQWTNKDRLPDAMLRDLIEHFSCLELTVANLPEDELGQGYEYLIKKFADDSGHTAAEFYTNRTVVHLMTEMLEPQSGESIYDPTCGSGGMLLSCITHLRRQKKEWRNVRLYGQERNLMTSSIARMNCFLHGIEDFQIVRGDTLAEPKLVEGDRLMRFDVVLANPPYSIKQWDRDAFASDPWGRNLYGTPPQGRADYAFWQHILQSLNPKTGRCAILFPHGVLFRQEEAEMRRKLVEADLVECVLGLGPNLFYNAAMEACVVICRTVKPKGRKGRTLFINAVNEVSRERAQSFLTEEHIEHIVEAYISFKDQPGFGKVVTLDELRKNEHSLKVDLYVATPTASNGNSSMASKQTSSLKGAFKAWCQSRVLVREALVRLLPNLEINGPEVESLKFAEIADFHSSINRKKWTPVRFGDVVTFVKDTVDPDSGELDRYVAGEHMETENVHIRQWGTVGDGYLGPAFIRRFRKGQVLYGSRRTYLKKVAVAEFEGITANTTFVLEGIAGKLHQPLLPWVMLSQRFTEHSVRESKGSTNPYINFPDIAKFEFDLPPLDEQRRIAEVLWELDKVSERWKKVKADIEYASLSQFRTSAIGATASDSILRDIGEFSAPLGWTVRRAKDLVSSPITKGATPSLKLNTESATVPFLKVYNLTFSGDLDFSVDPTYVERRAHEMELKRSRVRAGDILMNIVGPPLGKTAMVPGGFPESNINQAIAIYRIEDPVIRNYFFEYLRTDLAQAWLERRSKKTSGQRNLTLELAQDLPVPLPPPEILQEAVWTANKFATLKRDVASVLLAVSRLSQSIWNSL